MALEKQIISELNRMREIMGLSLLVEATLPPAVKSFVQDLLGYTEKQIDALEKSADDFSDFTKLSDEFSRLGIRNFDDLQRHVAQEMGIRSVDDVDPSVILKFMKESPEVMAGVTRKLNTLVADASESIINKAEWKDLVGDEFTNNVEELLKQQIDSRSSQYVADLSDQFQAAVGREIQDIESRGDIVPESLRNLYDDLGEKANQARNIQQNMGQDFSNVPGSIGNRVVDDVAGDVTDEVIDDLNPNDLLKDVLERNKTRLKRSYPDVTQDSIDDIMDELTTAYGRFDYQTLVTKLDEIGNSFKTKMKELQDEADEYIRQGKQDQADKVKVRLEKLKQVWNFVSENKITRFCLGNKTTVKPGTGGRETISTTDLNWSTFLRTPGCLAGLSVVLNFWYNYNKDPMDKEFIACAPANAMGICPNLPTGWCQSTCGQRTENYVGVNECFGAVPGWSDMPFKAKNGLMGLGLDCSYRQKDVAPEKFITNVKYFPAAAGGIEYWIITMNGKNYTVNANKGLPSGSSSTSGSSGTGGTGGTGGGYTNDEVSYIKYAKDKNAAYGRSGQYYWQDGKPFYKDSDGNWQQNQFDTDLKTFKN